MCEIHNDRDAYRKRIGFSIGDSREADKTMPCLDIACGNSSTKVTEIRASYHFSTLGMAPTTRQVDERLNGKHNPLAVLHNMDTAKGKRFRAYTCDDCTPRLYELLEKD